MYTHVLYDMYKREVCQISKCGKLYNSSIFLKMLHHVGYNNVFNKKKRNIKHCI